jgi:putative tryptophan/tyrosine transport system substrate-binding protein
MALGIGRRQLVSALGGAAACSLVRPRAVRAQMRISHVGVLVVVGETDPDAKRFIESFETNLDAAGWHSGRNIEIAYRWGASDRERLARYANELVQSAPDVLVAVGTPALVPLQKATATIPIVFTSVSDPVAQGFASSLAHPGGNMTGFSNFEPNIGSKWLELLKEVAPSVTQVAVMFNPQTSPYNALWMRSIETAAPAFAMSAVQASVQTEDDVRNAIGGLGAKSGNGLIVPSDSFTYERAALIASSTTSSKLPGIYAFSRFAREGGLLAYGVDLVDQLGKAAVYVDRILKGDKAGDLPVQGPTHYAMIINLKTAKVLGLTVPPALLATADEVVE